MIEPRLKGYSGHLYNYAASLKREIEKDGGKFCILVSPCCDKNIISELNGIPVFDANPSDKLFKFFLSRFLIVPIVFNFHLYRGLRLFIKQNSDQWNFFMGTTQYFDLFALFLFNFKIKATSNLYLTARLTNYRSDINRWSISTFWYKLFFHLLYLQNSFKKNLYIITDSENLQSEYEKITNFKINVLPIPHTLPHINKIAHSNLPVSEIIVASLGPARFQKGFIQIEKLISNYLKTKNHFALNVLFHLQCSAIQDQETRESVSRLKSLNSDNIVLYEEELSEDEYFSLLEKSDVVLVPYNRVSYFAQTSGVFTESIALGKIPIVNKPTWMSQQLDKFNVPTACDTDDEDSFYLLFKNICNNYSDYQKMMINVSSEWNKYHNPTNFIDLLFKLTRR